MIERRTVNKPRPDQRGCAARASSARPVPVPVVRAWGTAELETLILTPARVNGLIPEKSRVMFARRAAGAGTGGIGGHRLVRLTVIGRSSCLYNGVQNGARCG